MICQTELRFHPINESIIEAQTYLYYIQTPLSRPSEKVWTPYNEQTEESLRDDFKRLWATNFLDNLWIEKIDQPFPNGVMGHRVIYHMEERPRVKIVDYTGSTKVERTKIDEKMKELGIALRLDSFLDQSVVKRVQGIVKSFMADKGYEFAEVTSTVEPLPAGPKLVKVVFNVVEGPKVKVRTINFNGNTEVSDGALSRQMKSTKAHGFLSWITGKGTYNENKFDEDAEKVIEYYRNKGYISARVGQPEIKILEDSADKETRWVQLNIPIDEGPRYRVGNFKFDGNKIIKTEFLEPFFKLKPGDWYSDKPIRKGLIKAREGYGSLGYFEFTGFPDLEPVGGAEGPIAGPADPTVNVTMRMTEGEQYFVNRLTFSGNTTTRDNVIRREVRLLEGAPFNTEALKYSVKRLNQLGYFKPLEEGQGVDVQKTPGEKNQVDVTLKLEEQNRNQLTFGAGVSQFEGFFGQLSFQTSNFLGRGEALTVSLQIGIALRKLPGRLHGAVPLRPQHYRRRRRLQAHAALYRSVHAGRHRRQRHDGFPAGRLLAHVHDLQLRGDDGIGLESDLLRPRAGPAQSVPARFAAAWRRRQAHRQQGDAELRPQHRRQPDLPELGPAPDRVDRLRGPWRQHELRQAPVRIRALPAAQSPHGLRLPHADRVHPADCEHARICRSPKRCIWVASTRSAASTSAQSVRRTRNRPRARRQQDACCSTPNT